MLNTESALLSRTSGEAAKRPGVNGSAAMLTAAGHFNDAAMLQRNDGLIQVSEQAVDMPPEEKEIAAPDIVLGAPVPDHAGVHPELVASQPHVAPPKPRPVAKPAASSAAKPAQAAQAGTVLKTGPIAGKLSPDALCQEYAGMFRESLGLELSTAICFENMRRMCEIDTRDPCGTLYFLENTYRVSTLIYLASNLPVLFVTSVLAEKNRKNILKYVTIEVENGSKPYAELLELRKRRWIRKFENMAVNDAMTVTPGATMLTEELSGKLMAMLDDISRKLRQFNKEMTGIVAKFDDSARNDIVYIYSNWWYLLQGFENVPEMRAYIMAVTDDTRRNLKI